LAERINQISQALFAWSMDSAVHGWESVKVSPHSVPSQQQLPSSNIVCEAGPVTPWFNAQK
jgi:hypothetical protein